MSAAATVAPWAPCAPKFWGEKEEQQLVRMRLNGWSVKALAFVFARSMQAVEAKLKEHLCRKRHGRPALWIEELKSGRSNEEIAARLGTSVISVAGTRRYYQRTGKIAPATNPPEGQ